MAATTTATASILAVFCTNSSPKLSNTVIGQRSRVLNLIFDPISSSSSSIKCQNRCAYYSIRRRSTRLRAAGLMDIEPDLNEDPHDRWATNGAPLKILNMGFGMTITHTMKLQRKGEYLYIGAALFIIVFCIIGMDKPDKPHNVEPQIYNMESGALDKLIADYNIMDVWDFNEKYGDLWDFTVKRDDILKR